MLNISEAEHLPLHFISCSACPPFTRRVAVLFFLVLPYKFSKSPSYSPVIAVLYVKLGRVVVDPLRGRLQAAAHRNYENLQLCSQPGESPMKSPSLRFSLGRKGVCIVLTSSFPSWITFFCKTSFLVVPLRYSDWWQDSPERRNTTVLSVEIADAQQHLLLSNQSFCLALQLCHSTLLRKGWS